MRFWAGVGNLGHDTDRMRDNRDNPAPENIQLQVKITGVVIPSWLAVVMVLSAVLASVSTLISWERRTHEQKILEREIRILQVHSQDIENVLIRQGIATRRDFISPPNRSDKNTDQNEQKE